ncbi:unnamed protein product [Fusarium graminearum]|nr:unnamed protein product [Fusarium graminearum]VTO82719.1 unnamed protein product [Fusarium graminearum]
MSLPYRCTIRPDDPSPVRDGYERAFRHSHYADIDSMTESDPIPFRRLHNLATTELDRVSVGEDRPSLDQDNVALAMFGCEVLCLYNIGPHEYTWVRQDESYLPVIGSVASEVKCSLCHRPQSI